jgi:hypothetical protein
MKLNVDFSELEACVHQMGAGIRNREANLTTRTGESHDCLAGTAIPTRQPLEPSSATLDAYVRGAHCETENDEVATQSSID